MDWDSEQTVIIAKILCLSLFQVTLVGILLILNWLSFPWRNPADWGEAGQTQ
jgi:hypothetical protein